LANREYLREKQQSITKQLVVAQASGQKDEQDRLMAEFELLRKMRSRTESKIEPGGGVIVSGTSWGLDK
jgi:hypothetical protein